MTFSKLNNLHRVLYERAYREALAVDVISSPVIGEYRKRFERSLSEDVEEVGYRNLVEGVKKSDVVLYGDFHTFAQSQRGFLRLLREVVEADRKRSGDGEVVLAMELFRAKDQKILDEYIGGEIELKELLEQTRYVKMWGFPPDQYINILNFAKSNNLRVIGINSDKGGKDELAVRDEFAARVMSDYLRENVSHKILCLVGEYHLADAHLPKYLKKELRDRAFTTRVCRVVNNIDKYYFKLRHEPSSIDTTCVKLKKDFYCIINSTPWLKWQSFNTWNEWVNSESSVSLTMFEDTVADDLNASDENYIGLDLDSRVLEFARVITSFLNLKVADSELSKFDLYLNPNLETFLKLRADYKLSHNEVLRAFERTMYDGVYVLDCSPIVMVLTGFSLNILSAAVGQFLSSLLLKVESTVLDARASFYKRVLKFAFGVLSSKILNPKRKVHSIDYYEKELSEYVQFKTSGSEKRFREILTQCLKHHRDLVKGHLSDTTGSNIFILDKHSNYEISSILGNILGTELYEAIAQGKVSADKMNSLFFDKTQKTSEFSSVFLGFYKLILS